MAQILFPYDGSNLIDKKTFRVGGSNLVKMGQPVELVSGTEGEVARITSASAQGSANKFIGYAEPDESWEAKSETDSFAVGELLGVAMRGPVIKGMCGTTISINDLLTFDSSGNLTGDLDDSFDAKNGGSLALAYMGIALQAGGSGSRIEYVRL